MTRSLSLDGCFEKISRAREHLNALREEIKASIDSGAYGVAGYLDEESGWKFVEFEMHVPPPLRWGIIVGDAAHNMRSALDHLVYELSGHKRTTQFPIFTNAGEYLDLDLDTEKSKRDRMLEGVPAADRTVIDNYQPFQRVGEQAKDPLARLAWLNNADKHRVIHTAVVNISRFEDLTVDFLDDDVHGFDVFPCFEPPAEMKQGTKLYRIRTRPNPASKVNVSSKVPLRVAFGKGSRFLETGDLNLIADYVARIVDRFRYRP